MLYKLNIQKVMHIEAVTRVKRFPLNVNRYFHPMNSALNMQAKSFNDDIAIRNQCMENTWFSRVPFKIHFVQ